MDARARSSAPPSSSSLCPSCGKAVDVLRAGEVAILDGAFRYFCDRGCKASYVEVSSKRASLEAMTLEPPLVASSIPSGVRSAGTREALSSKAPSFPAAEESKAPPVVFREIEPTPSPSPAPGSPTDVVVAPGTFPPAVRTSRSPTPPPQAADDDAVAQDPIAFERTEPDPVERAVQEAETAPIETVPPATLRSPDADAALDANAEPAVSARAKRRSRAETDGAREEGDDDEAAGEGSRSAAVDDSADGRNDRGIDFVPGVFALAGLLSAVVGLAGELGTTLRLPLALAAAAVAIGRGLFRQREPSETSPLVAAGALTIASVAVIGARVTHDPHADAHVVFVGLAAAAVLFAEIFVRRSRRDVLEWRAKTTTALAVEARVVRGDGVAKVDAASVKPGEQVVVELGETIPVDGIVAAGGGEVAPWLDSPVVSERREGDAVVAGATVTSGRLRVTATFSGTERAWVRLAHSSSARVDVAAPVVATARRFIERGAPLCALVVAGAVYANNGTWADVVVAATAGAFALGATAATAAAALAHARGHTAAQRRGIVYKDAIAFDAAARADIAVVCSRGTVLLGEPEIVATETVQKRGDEEIDVARVLSLAAGAELASNHPFAAAVLRCARARGVRPENVRSALVHQGLGVTALAPSGDKLIVGSRAFLLKERVSVAVADARVTELEAEGRSVLLVALGDRLVGLLALQDGLRPGARAAVQRLHDARIEPVLLSGEARDTCETIARSLDIEHVRPEILPADRGAEVRALADGGHVVAAIGHPTSDDGALGAADVAVAMGAAGSAPGEWSVALASDDVRDAALALTIPRACRERAKTAVAVGACAHAASVLAIVFGLAPPALAPVLSVVASLVAFVVVRDPTALPSRR